MRGLWYESINFGAVGGRLRHWSRHSLHVPKYTRWCTSLGRFLEEPSSLLVRPHQTESIIWGNVGGRWRYGMRFWGQDKALINTFFETMWVAGPSFRALSGRLKFTVRRHKFNTDSSGSVALQRSVSPQRFLVVRRWNNGGVAGEAMGNAHYS